jgi:putative ABC transport system permease protein
MMSLLPILQGAVERGLLYALVVIAVYITSRIIRFDDLSVEGSFGVGGAVTAACLAHGLSIWLAFPCALIAGALSGLCTALLHTHLKLNNLISGIITTTALFSICLKLASSNVMLTDKQTLVSFVPALLLFTGITALVLCALNWFLTTEVGFLLRALGSNPRMLANVGKQSNYYLIAGLMLANMLTACTGSLFVQYVGYFSIWANVGTLVIAMTGLIIAELLSTTCGINMIIGAIAYQAVIAATFEFHVDQEWNKLITALLLVALLALKKMLINRPTAQRTLS